MAGSLGGFDGVSRRSCFQGRRPPAGRVFPPLPRPRPVIRALEVRRPQRPLRPSRSPPQLCPQGTGASFEAVKSVLPPREGKGGTCVKCFQTLWDVFTVFSNAVFKMGDKSLQIAMEAAPVWRGFQSSVGLQPEGSSGCQKTHLNTQYENCTMKIQN